MSTRAKNMIYFFILRFLAFTVKETILWLAGAVHPGCRLSALYHCPLRPQNRPDLYRDSRAGRGKSLRAGGDHRAGEGIL